MNDAPPSYGRWTLGLLAGWVLLRLVWIGRFELSGDEAYYWLWSQHLDWNYFSKGPGIAWTMALFTGLFGDTGFAIRLPTVLLSAGAGWGLYCLGRDLFSPRVGFWTVALASLFPLFALGGLLMTIDPLSVFFWTWTLWWAWRLRGANSAFAWAVPGVLIGLGELCKYTNIALVPSLGLFLALDRTMPARRRLGAFLVMTACALLLLAPSVAWMAHHDWITLHHLQDRGSLDEPFRIQPGQWLEFLGLQSLIVFPAFFIAFALVLIAGRARWLSTPEGRFLLCAFAPLFGFYAVLALNDAGQPNWTAPAWVAGVLLLAAGWIDLRERSLRARRWERPAVAASALVIVVLHAMIFFPMPRKGSHDALHRIRGARELAAAVDRQLAAAPAAFVIGDHYQVAALVAFYSANHPAAFTVDDGRINDQFDLWPSYRDLPSGSDGLFVARNDRIPDALRGQFDRIQPLGEVTPHFGSSLVYRYHLFLCRGLKPRGPAGGPS